MWQEMRKHEKKLRGMIVDYKKRSERRKEYYEKIVRRLASISERLVSSFDLETRSGGIPADLGSTGEDSLGSGDRHGG